MSEQRTLLLDRCNGSDGCVCCVVVVVLGVAAVAFSSKSKACKTKASVSVSGTGGVVGCSFVMLFLSTGPLLLLLLLLFPSPMVDDRII